MRARMTATAWGQGVKNALICSIGVFLCWFVIAVPIWQIAGLTLLISSGIAFAALWCLALVGVVGTWLYGRAAAGRVLLDCGPHPIRWLFLINAVLFLVVGIAGFSAASFVPGLYWTVPFLPVSLAVYWLIMASGRLQIRENGLWGYWGLLRWNKIGNYEWEADSTLIVRSKGVLSLLQGALPVPPEHQQDVHDLLVQHCSTQKAAEPAAPGDKAGM